MSVLGEMANLYGVTLDYLVRAENVEDAVIERKEKVLTDNRALFGSRNGERISVSVAADGEIIKGNGSLNEAAITGESIPVEKTVGDKVICATVNTGGYFEMKVQKTGEDTTLSQIIRLVEEASATKAPIARLADKISGIFVPVVMTIAVITFIVWMLCGQNFEFALSRGIAVLVISCPCALVISVPMAFFGGIGGYAKKFGMIWLRIKPHFS